MKNKLLITGALLFSLAIAKAQDTTVTFQFNLQECIDYAFEHHYQVRNAEVDVELAESEVKETIGRGLPKVNGNVRSEEQTSELPSLMRISYAVFCLKKKRCRYNILLPNY